MTTIVLIDVEMSRCPFSDTDTNTPIPRANTNSIEIKSKVIIFCGTCLVWSTLVIILYSFDILQTLFNMFKQIANRYYNFFSLSEIYCLAVITDHWTFPSLCFKCCQFKGIFIVIAMQVMTQ